VGAPLGSVRGTASQAAARGGGRGAALGREGREGADGRKSMKALAPIIYEPKGRAREYAELACNLAVGCVHRCSYCFGPGAFRCSVEDWGTVQRKANLVERFERDAQRYAGDPREILFSFATDPLGTEEQVADLRAVLPIAERYRLRLTVLSKNPVAAAEFLPQFWANDWSLGTTICFLDEALRATWEPGAPSIAARFEGLRAARAAGVRTWASVEPVVEPEEGLQAIRALLPLIDLIKIGKWNHDRRAAAIDWEGFLDRAVALIGDRPRVLKVDLLAAAGYIVEADGWWRRPLGTSRIKGRTDTATGKEI
jgi:hypothetical protein